MMEGFAKLETVVDASKIIVIRVVQKSDSPHTARVTAASCGLISLREPWGFLGIQYLLGPHLSAMWPSATRCETKQCEPRVLSNVTYVLPIWRRSMNVAPQEELCPALSDDGPEALAS